MADTLSRTNDPYPIALAWADAYNAHDVERLLSLYDERVINTQLPYPNPVEGRASMRGVYERLFQSFPDIRLAVENVSVDGETTVVEWRFGGTMKGEFAGHPPTGRSFTLRGCEIFRISDGKILTQQGYWDKASMLTQLGLA